MLSSNAIVMYFRVGMGAEFHSDGVGGSEVLGSPSVGFRLVGMGSGLSVGWVWWSGREPDPRR